MPVVIKPCTCQSPYQDGKYGPGNRVKNESGKDKAPACTVCGRRV